MRSFFRGSFACAGVCLLAVLTGCSGSSPSSSPSAPVTSPTPAVALSITSVAPTKVPAGSANFQLTVNGTGFQTGTALKVGGAAVTSTFVSTTQLTATVPAKSVSNGALLPVVAANGTATSASDTSAVKLEVDNPLPQISSFAPLSLVAGSGSTTLSVTGSGFVPSTVIQVNGSSRPTAFVSGTQVNLTVTDADLASGGALTLLAFNPAPAGGTSSAATVPIAYPAPGSITLSPSVVPSGGQTTTSIAVTGTNFVSGSVAQLNGSARPTKVVSATQLTFTLTVSDQAAVGTSKVTVTNPQPGGGTSAPATLTFATPTPTPAITSVSPMQFVLNSATTVYVSGTNLDNTSVVNWDGKALATTYVPASYGYGYSAAYLAASVTTDLLTATGNVSITVSSPTSPAASNAVTVQIVNPPVPTLTSLTPAATPLNTAATVTVVGKDFTSSSTAQMDGMALATSFQDGGTLTATVPASMVSLPGAHSITVSTPAPGGGVSSALPFTSYIALPNTAMALNPVSGLLYVSVPSSAGLPYANSVVPVDPATGIIGAPILVGSEPGKLAISSDGTTLWVALDAASAVRKVDLTTGTAGMQFSFGGNQGIYAYPPIAHALAALPGSTTSVAVSASFDTNVYQDGLIIYDNGVARTNQSTLSTISTPPALFMNPTKPELYATSYESGYHVYQYDSHGLTQIGGDQSNYAFGANYGTALQVDNGRAYLDTGKVLDAETGTLLGTFYTDGTNVASGPMVSDSSVGRNFILLGTSPYYNFTNPGQAAPLTIQAFDESNQTLIPGAAIALSGAVTGTKYGAGNSTATEVNGPNDIDTMVRWGSNGIAFRAANGIFSFRSNIIHDLSNTKADVQLTATAPASGRTGTSFNAVATILNQGPSAATNVSVVETLPANVTVVSATASQGACSAQSTVTCNLGSLANGASATVTLVLQGNNDGDATVSAAVSASEADPQGGNNSASTKTTLSGGAYALIPQVSSVSPNVAQAGSPDVVVTVTGTGFAAGSTVNWAGSALATSVVSGTQLTATVPASSLASLGWAPVTVTTPSPGGGTSNALPFVIYNTIKLAANRLAADPFTGRLYATTNSAATETTGNALVVIDPLTGALGTPVSVGSQPGKMAFSDDGNLMYIVQKGANSVGRFNLLSQTLEFSFPVSPSGNGYSVADDAPRDAAVAPGSENLVAVDLGSWPGTALYDVDPRAQTATARTGSYGQNTTGAYTGSSLQFLDSSTLFTHDADTTGGSLYRWTVTPTGLSGGYSSEYTLNSFGSFTIHGGLGYSDAGGVADLTVTPPTQKGVFIEPLLPNDPSNYYSTFGQLTAADPSLGRSFFVLAPPTFTSDPAPPLTLNAFDESSYVLTDTLSIPYHVQTSSTNNGVSSVANADLVRWGQDGLAVLRTDGQIVLLRGGFVVPELLTPHAAASLTSVSQSTLAHGSGNVVLTATGSGFLPGVGIFWNGAYRTTNRIDSGHLTFNVPASDLVGAGSATITANNPNAPASNTLTETIN